MINLNTRIGVRVCIIAMMVIMVITSAFLYSFLFGSQDLPISGQLIVPLENIDLDSFNSLQQP